MAKEGFLPHGGKETEHGYREKPGEDIPFKDMLMMT